MNIRTHLLVILIGMSCSALAQDKIYKKDGVIINAKVKVVGTTSVTYKRYDNPEGPEYTILKKELVQIKYENGTIDVFERPDAKEGHRSAGKDGAKKEKFAQKYGANIISIIPAAYTASVDGTINDVGIGICYERALDERGHISFNLPVLVSFLSNNDFANNVVYNYTPGTTSYGTYYSWYIMPGIKFYPAPNIYRVRYSLGVSFFAILGSEPYAVYDNNNQTSNYNEGDHNYTMYGFMLSNSVNIAATKHLGMALDLGMGIPVSDNRYADNNGGLVAFNGPFIQIGLKLGYRF